jgi:hypothetical protein
MAGNRKAAEQVIIEMVEAILPGGGNKAIYEDFFSKMSDKDFDQWMEDINSGAKRPFIYAPNNAKVKLSTERNFAIAKKINHNFFERLWIDHKDPDRPKYLTNVPHIVLELPIRRQSQLLVKKLSVAEHNKSIDSLSGQPAGKSSRSAKISYPELQILMGMNLPKTLIELMKYRGGDRGGFNAMNRAISADGSVTLKSIDHLSTGVESTKTLNAYLTAMHLRNTLVS